MVAAIIQRFSSGKRWITAPGILGVFTNLVLFLVVAIAGGAGSAYYMVDRGSPLTTRHIGPWTIWTAAAQSDADPYTRAHFVRQGTLPLSSSVARIYQARTDNNGGRLRATCDYLLEGKAPDASWWSMAAYTSDGRLISNAAQRHSFTASTIMRRSDGRYEIVLARGARAGNWLPSGSSGYLLLVLTIQQPGYARQLADPAAAAAAEAAQLPTIKKMACR